MKLKIYFILKCVIIDFQWGFFFVLLEYNNLCINLINFN